MRIEGLTVHEVVRSARELMEMSQTDLAKALGVTSAYISMLESGRRYPRVQFQNDIYWRLSCLVGGAAPDGRLGFYSDLIALDLMEREPGLFECLGRFFHRELFAGQGRENHTQETLNPTDVGPSLPTAEEKNSERTQGIMKIAYPHKA